MSDSELDFFEPEPKPTPKRKVGSKETKRSSSSKKPKPIRHEKLDVLGLLSEDEESVSTEHSQRASASAKHLDSSISSRVANGSLVRRTQLDGQYYVETRVYVAADALSASPETRFKKALVTLKVQLDSDQPEWTCLQKFLQKTKSSLFADTKPIFYNNK